MLGHGLLVCSVYGEVKGKERLTDGFASLLGGVIVGDVGVVGT